jgi:hypothetical protein
MMRLRSGSLHDSSFVERHRQSIDRGSVFDDVVKASQRLSKSMTLAERAALIRRQGSIYLNRRWLNRNLKRSLPTRPYILVSLHYQPEASTCMVASEWVDQDSVIEQAAINGSSEFCIAVKENPKGFGLRGERFYARLSGLTNVELIHPLVPNDGLLRNAAAVLSVAGTVGMEAIALGKRLAILGRPSYDIFEGARKIGHPKEIFAHLADQCWKPDEMTEQRRAFLAALKQSTFYAGPPWHGPWPDPKTGGPNYACAIDGFLGFLERTDFLVEDVDVSL